MKQVYFLFLVIAITISCTSWRAATNVKGGTNEAIQIAINDFMKANKHGSKDSVFYVYTKDISENILGINVSATYDKVLISTEDSTTYNYDGLPSGYVEKGGDLFYWHDTPSNYQGIDKVIPVLRRFSLLDTMIVSVYMPPSTISHDKKGTDYYFCKNDLSRFKKVRTTKAMGYYNPPKVKCHK